MLWAWDAEMQMGVRGKYRGVATAHLEGFSRADRGGGGQATSRPDP